MNKVFEDLCSLVDLFWQGESWDKRGPKPKQLPNFYLKLYWFGLLFGCTEKSRFLSRAEKEYPQLFKKALPEHCFTTIVGN